MLVLGSALLTILDNVVVKGAVIVLSAWLLFRMSRSLRAAPGDPWMALTADEARELRVLFASFGCFMASEIACTVEIALAGQSALMDGVHAVTSAIGMGLFGLWLVLFVDRAVVRYGRPGCALDRVCRGCTFADPARCKLLRTALLVGAFAVAMGIVPLFASAEPLPADLRRYPMPWGLDGWYEMSIVPRLSAALGFDPTAMEYAIPRSTRVLEVRVIPAAGAATCAMAVGLLWRRRELRGLQVLGFGAGLLAYAYLQLALFAATREPIVGSLGHELSELWFVVLTAEILRRGFAPGRRRATTGDARGAHRQS